MSYKTQCLFGRCRVLVLRPPCTKAADPWSVSNRFRRWLSGILGREWEAGRELGQRQVPSPGLALGLEESWHEEKRLEAGGFGVLDAVATLVGFLLDYNYIQCSITCFLTIIHFMHRRWELYGLIFGKSELSDLGFLQTDHVQAGWLVADHISITCQCQSTESTMNGTVEFCKTAKGRLT